MRSITRSWTTIQSAAHYVNILQHWSAGTLREERKEASACYSMGGEGGDEEAQKEDAPFTIIRRPVNTSC